MIVLQSVILTFFALVLYVSSSILPSPNGIYEQGNESILISNNFKITCDSFIPPDDLEEAIENTLLSIQNYKFNRLIVGRGLRDAPLLVNASILSRIRLEIESTPSPLNIYDSNPFLTTIPSISEEINKDFDDPSLDESYTLIIPVEAEALISSKTSLGLLRGLQSFIQLIYTLPNTSTSSISSSTDQSYILNVPIFIQDSPSFKWRGLMLDTSRHFFSIEDIERTLETMSTCKLNVFHWHITDAPSFPLQHPHYPLLFKSAYSPSQTYSQTQISHLETFANRIGIQLILELDLPGHTASLGNSYPEYMACWNEEEGQWEGKANEPPKGQLRIGDFETREFMKGLIGDVAKLRKSNYFSTGGDEVNMKCYSLDERTQSDLKLKNITIEEALSDFVLDVHDSLHQISKTLIVWQEMILSHNILLSKDTIIMVWISSEDVKKVIEENFRVIHTASDFFYLDCGLGGWLGNTISKSWCSPFKTWSKIYSFNPFNNISTEQQHLILGGESLLWTEQVDNSNFESLLWPRAAVTAEVFWTGSHLAQSNPGSKEKGEERNFKEFLPRLHEWRYRAVERGIKAAPLQPEWCALRPGACDL